MAAKDNLSLETLLRVHFPDSHHHIKHIEQMGSLINHKDLLRKSYRSHYKRLDKRGKRLMILFKEGDLAKIKEHTVTLAEFQDIKDGLGRNLLYWSIHHKHQNILDFFYEVAANHQDKTKDNLLHWKIRCQQKIDNIPRTFDRHKIFQTAAKYGSLPIISQLATTETQSLYCSLNQAIQWGQLEIVTHLLQFSDIDTQQIDREVIFLAAMRNFMETVHYVLAFIKEKDPGYSCFLFETLLKQIFQATHDNKLAYYIFKHICDLALELNINLNSLHMNSHSILSMAATSEDIHLVTHIYHLVQQSSKDYFNPMDTILSAFSLMNLAGKHADRVCGFLCDKLEELHINLQEAISPSQIYEESLPIEITKNVPIFMFLMAANANDIAAIKYIYTRYRTHELPISDAILIATHAHKDHITHFLQQL